MLGKLIAEANHHQNDPESLQLQRDLWDLQTTLLTLLHDAARQVLSEVNDKKAATIVLALWIRDTAPDAMSPCGALARLLIEAET